MPAWPALWERPAAEIELDDLIPVLARLVRIKKLRETGKIRSYLRAAYAAAIRAKQDAAAPDSLRAVNLSRNPAQDLATVDSGTPREYALSVAELRAYWRRIAVLPGARGAMLRFHLLIGAQRISQMARLVATDIDQDHQSIRILDIKGRRQRPRTHVVPLMPQAMAALLGMQARRLAHSSSPLPMAWSRSRMTYSEAVSTTWWRPWIPPESWMGPASRQATFAAQSRHAWLQLATPKRSEAMCSRMA